MSSLPGRLPPPPLSYTEHWANQLPYWTPGELTPGETPPVAQRTAIVNPLVGRRPDALPLDQSLNGSSFAQKLPNSPNQLDGAGGLGAQSPPTFDTLSSISGGGGGLGSTDGGVLHRRRYRRIGCPDDDEEELDKHAKIQEQKMAFDEQLVEKQRLRTIDEAREKQEIIHAERERRRIEQRETLENSTELNKWKDMRDVEEARERKIKDAMERAKEEARLLKHAKLHHHARQAQTEFLDRPPVPPPIKLAPLDTTRSDSLQSNLSSSFRNESWRAPPPEDEHLMQLSQSIDALQRAQEEAEALIKREKLQKELNQPRVEETSPSRSKSLPPKSPLSVRNPLDERPIRPQQKDPLELWEQVNQSNGHQETDGGMRRKSQSSKQLETPPPQRPPRRKKEASLSRPLQNGTASSSSEKPMESKHSVPAKPPVDKSRKLLNKRPSVDQMLYPNGTKEEGASKKKSDQPPTNGVSSSDENPWGETLGGLNPLYQPITTRSSRPRRRGAKDSGEESSSQSSVRDSQTISSPSPSSQHSPPFDEKRRWRPTSKPPPPTSPPAGKIASLRISKDDEVLPRPGALKPSASLETFNARTPMYSSLSAKHGKPAGRQQRILEQLANLRQQLKSKQQEVESALKKPSGFGFGSRRSSFSNGRNS